MRIFLLAAILALPFGAHAEKLDKEGYCRIVGQLATASMEWRQKGYALEDALSKTDLLSVAQFRPTFKMLLIEAYGRPAFQTQEHRRRSIVDFAAQATTTCFKSVKGDGV